MPPALHVSDLGIVTQWHSSSLTLQVWNCLPMAALFYLCGNCSALTFTAWLLLCSDPSLIYWSVLSFLLTKCSVLIYKPLKLAKVINVIFWCKLDIHKLPKGHDASRKKCGPTLNLSSIHLKAEVPCVQAYSTSSHSEVLFSQQQARKSSQIWERAVLRSVGKYSFWFHPTLFWDEETILR